MLRKFTWSKRPFKDHISFLFCLQKALWFISRIFTKLDLCEWQGFHTHLFSKIHVLGSHKIGILLYSSSAPDVESPGPSPTTTATSIYLKHQEWAPCNSGGWQQSYKNAVLPLRLKGTAMSEPLYLRGCHPSQDGTKPPQSICMFLRRMSPKMSPQWPSPYLYL